MIRAIGNKEAEFAKTDEARQAVAAFNGRRDALLAEYEHLRREAAAICDIAPGQKPGEAAGLIARCRSLAERKLRNALELLELPAMRAACEEPILRGYDAELAQLAKAREAREKELAEIARINNLNASRLQVADDAWQKLGKDREYIEAVRRVVPENCRMQTDEREWTKAIQRETKEIVASELRIAVPTPPKQSVFIGG